jgi:hypothetical protein
VATGRYRHGAPPRVPSPPMPAAPVPPVARPPVWDPWSAEAPTEPVSRRSVAAICGFVALGLLVLLSPLLIYAAGSVYRRTQEPRTFDDPLVRNVASLACGTLHEDLERIPVAPTTAPVLRRRAAIDAENVAVTRLVDRMRALGPERLAADPPAAEWVAGWETLVAVRADVAAGLGEGTYDAARDPRLRGLLARMNAVDACRVPTRLVPLVETPGG